MSIIIGIDPGQNTGIATFVNGDLTDLETVTPYAMVKILQGRGARRVIFEDSRLQSHTWSTTISRPAALKMARNVGEIDAWCRLIVSLCAEAGIPAHGISPQGKGAKLSAEAFKKATGWTGTSNQHERDAAMVAWPYRRAAK